VYGVNISQLIRYSRACAQYSYCLERAQILTQKLCKQADVASRLTVTKYPSDDNGSSPFYVDFFFPLPPTLLLSDLTLYIWVTRRVSYMKQELITLHEHLSSPSGFDGIRVAHLFYVFALFLLVMSDMMSIISRVRHQCYVWYDVYYLSTSPSVLCSVLVVFYFCPDVFLRS
jgi:hypothetical protein